MHLTACIAVSIVMAALTQTPASQPGDAADTEELSRLEQVWNEAHTRGDAEAYIRRGGTWQVVAWHASTAAQP